MQTANRVIIITAATLWIWVLVVLILLAWAVPPERPPQWVADVADFMRAHTDTLSRLIFSLALAILILLALALVIFELAPPPQGAVKVTNVKAGNALLGTDIIAQRLERDLRALESVTDVQVTVQGRGKGVDVAIDLGVEAEANLADVSERAATLVRDSVESRMGVALNTPPKIRLRYAARTGEPPHRAEAGAIEERRPPGSPS